MKRTFLIIPISLALILSGCELFIIGALEKTTRDEMYDYMQNDNGWEVTSVTEYDAERNHPDSSFVVVLDSTWYPNSTLIFEDGKENDNYLYKPLTYIDANGNSSIGQYDLYPDGDNPAFSFHEWDDNPFPDEVGGPFFLEVWENGVLTIASRIEHTYYERYVVIQMNKK